jgi:hypothetical protein
MSLHHHLHLGPVLTPLPLSLLLLPLLLLMAIPVLMPLPFLLLLMEGPAVLVQLLIPVVSQQLGTQLWLPTPVYLTCLLQRPVQMAS